MEQTNAARRLHDILEQALATGDGNKLIYQVLATVLDIKSPDENRHLFTEFFELLAEVERSTKQLKKVKNLERYVNSIQEIQSLIFAYGIFQGKWDSLSSTIQNRNLNLVLDSCANFIAQEQIESSLSEEQLRDYLEQCESLLQEVMESDLPEDIKTFLIKRLEEVCTAIRHYRLGGPERLRTVVEASIGAMAVQCMARPDLQNQRKSIWNTTFKLLSGIAMVVGLAADTKSFVIPQTEELIKLLPPGQITQK